MTAGRRKAFQNRVDREAERKNPMLSERRALVHTLPDGILGHQSREANQREMLAYKMSEVPK